jgi:sensor histidine kinase YesM
VEGQEGGIGLENAKRRLDLMYGDKYQLDIVEAGDNFTVELIIPGL